MKQFLKYLCIFIMISTFLLTWKTINKNKKTEKMESITQEEQISHEEKRALFFSYIECSHYLQDKTEEEAKKNIHTVIQTMKENGFNMLLLQVRSFSDAIYPSNLFPSSKAVVHQEGDTLPFDFLKTFLDEAHQEDIEVHAWINPYRIRTAADMENIDENNPAMEALQEGYAQKMNGKGIYYNPAREETKQLILNGILEIIDNYPVDGIHFDDYFYPDLEIDEEEYQEARKMDLSLTHDDFRLAQVSDLIKRVYQLVKNKNQKLLFGISPAGNNENNYTSNFVDTKRFAQEKGYVDYLMPQIYYGFENETKPFIETVNEWNNLIQIEGVSLIPALAFYKVGQEDPYALSGKDEWVHGEDIIRKEVLVSRNLSQYEGFSLFRYDSLFGEEPTELVSLELENLKEALQENR